MGRQFPTIDMSLSSSCRDQRRQGGFAAGDCPPVGDQACLLEVPSMASDATALQLRASRGDRFYAVKRFSRVADAEK